MDRHSPPTRASLLSRLKNPDDHGSWQTFFDTYGSFIHAQAKNGGLTDDEAQEVLQETMIEVSEPIKTFQYDSRIGSFKAWLFHQTRLRMADQFRKRRPEDVPLDCVTLEDSQVDRPSASFALPCVEPDGRWEEEWQMAIIVAAVQRLRPQVTLKNFQVIDLIFTKQWRVARVNDTLKMNRAHVHLLKFRALRLLKKELTRMEMAGI